MTIPDVARSGKEAFLREWGTVLVIVLVGVAAFGLGRLSALDANTMEDVRIDTVTLPAAAGLQTGSPNTTTTSLSGKVVASKSGSVYHLPWCSGAQRIKEENKVWFASKEEAEKAGLRPAANCPGL